MTKKFIATIKVLAYIVIIIFALIIPIFIARNIFVRLLNFKGNELDIIPNQISNLAKKLSKIVDELMK